MKVAKGPESFLSTFTWHVMLAIVILTSLVSLAGIPKELTASYSFTQAVIGGFKINEELVGVEEQLRHFLEKFAAS